METAKHTPGPWVIGAYGRITTPDGEVLRTCGVALPGADSDEYRANTRLIAAAPELLAACQAIVEYQRLAESDETYGLLNAYAKAFEASIAAVAKATGEPA